MKLKYEDKELIETMTFISPGLGANEISLGEGSEIIKFILVFNADEKNKEDLSITKVDANTLKIEMSNWNNSLGTTLTDLLEVGTFRKRRLYILFTVKKAGSKGNIREVIFCAYLGAEVQDGAN